VHAGFARALMRELAGQLAHQREPAYAAAFGKLDYRRTDAPAHELKRAPLAGRALELGVGERGEAVEMTRGRA